MEMDNDWSDQLFMFGNRPQILGRTYYNTRVSYPLCLLLYMIYTIQGLDHLKISLSPFLPGLCTLDYNS